MSDRTTVVVELTQGNLNNAHFNLRDHLGLFPSEVIGPANEMDGLGRTVTVLYDGVAEPCETDIAGAHKAFFRRRGPIRAFFALHKLAAGDHICLTWEGMDTYTVRPLRR